MINQNSMILLFIIKLWTKCKTAYDIFFLIKAYFNKLQFLKPLYESAK